MTARRGMAIASSAMAMTVALALATSGQADTAEPAKETAAREHPRGLVLNCSKQSGTGAGLNQFSNRWNLVAGPLALIGGAKLGQDLASLEPFGGAKFPLLGKGGHRVTLELSRETRRGAGLTYGQRASGSYGYRVITFVACRRDERAGRNIAEGWPVSFWSGGVLTRSPRCVPLLIWVDDAPAPRRAVLHVGVRRCG